MTATASHLSLQIENEFDAIPAANDTVSQWLEERGATPAFVYLANLSIEELATNCIKYGYDDTAIHIICIELEISPTGLVITVIDDGHPFNPLELAEPDTSLPIGDRPIGGLGIHLLRKLSSTMRYERVDGKNRVSLTKTNHPSKS